MIDSTDYQIHTSAPSVARTQSILRLIIMTLLALLLVSQARVVLAGWVPAYLTAQGLEDGVLLEWATISEYNLSGFEILCKLEGEPDEAFHPIASLPAEGSLESGAYYTHFVDSGLAPGESYCFRIQEIALVEEPPEYVDICGYGLGIEPAEAPVLQEPQTGSVEVVTTAVGTPPPVQSLDSTPTPITILPSGATGGSVATPLTSLPTTVPPPFPTLTPFAAPPATATPQPGSESPMATPLVPPTGGNASAPPGSDQSPLATPESSNETGMAIPQSVQTAPPAGDANTVAQSQAGNGPTGNSGGDGAVPGSAGDQPAGAQGPAYIVVTAVPTPAATFTPLPTATPLPDTGLLAEMSNPTVDNLVLMTLCFTFMGAGSLGALGLTATALYMRSRQRRD